MSDVGLRLSAGQPPCKAAPRTNNCDNGQPYPVPTVRTVGIKIGCEMSRQDPERPNPEGHVQHPVIIFIVLPLNNPFHDSSVNREDWFGEGFTVNQSKNKGFALGCDSWPILGGVFLCALRVLCGEKVLPLLFVFAVAFPLCSSVSFVVKRFCFCSCLCSSITQLPTYPFTQSLSILCVEGLGFSFGNSGDVACPRGELARAEGAISGWEFRSPN
jgi:hypothetical protein